MGFFDFLKKTGTATGNKPDAGDTAFEAIIEEAYNEKQHKSINYWGIKANEFEVFNKKVLSLSDKEKVNFILTAGQKVHNYYASFKIPDTVDRRWQQAYITDAFMRHLFRTALVLDDGDIQSLVHLFIKYNPSKWNHSIMAWPLASFLKLIEKYIKQHGTTSMLKDSLATLQSALSEDKAALGKEKLKVKEKLDALMFQVGNEKDAVMPVFFPGNDEFARQANEDIQNAPEHDRSYWFQLLALSRQASGARPSQKCLDAARGILNVLGVDKFNKQVNAWLELMAKMKDSEQQHHLYRDYTTIEFLSPANADMVKGLIWMCAHLQDKTTLYNLAALAERAYRKIPGKGPAAPSIGNACLFTLANSNGLDGVGHLSRLKLRIPQTNVQNLITKYLQEAAEKQNTSVHEIEDLAVDDNGFADGKREYDLEGYTLKLQIASIGKVEQEWFKPDGSPQKSIPAAVKEKHSDQLKKIKELVKQAEVTLTAQRDRIDRMFKANRKIPTNKFNEFYFSHGLMSFLTKKLIWNIERNGEVNAVFFKDGKWVNNKAEAIDVLTDTQTVFSLWHPVFSTVEDIRAWREFMMEHKIVQPLKQAFREVYLLTDAEINTSTYSNRMAAHILKQHQFNSLAKGRGWKYSLLGAYDDGRNNESASIDLPDYGLRAEFWVNEVNADNAMNDTGIWLYIATDQVQFLNTASNEVVELLDVPAVVLSEIMRDVDLFVGVASVGNDPAWRDNGGIPVYRDYWQSYSFGELTEVAKTRKIILEKLLPRLKIARIATIRDKFLVVQGKLRTYKIHIGSTNILMEPNDQYLCIVPDRSKPDTTNVFLPFEGDNGLSIIISKALLLSEDDAITDPTITRQINSN
ncbi:MAG TPA: DUF4132 domain-containing protein [Chitinophagaceae bacterium]|nr:DUF4132 domain-containing protein [Chitinophagaceae bacterium]